MAFSFSFILLYTEKRSLYWNPLNSPFFLFYTSHYDWKILFTDIQLVRDQYHSFRNMLQIIHFQLTDFLTKETNP